VDFRWKFAQLSASLSHLLHPKAALPETPISWEAYQAHGQRSPFDSGFQILLLSNSPDIKAPVPPTRKAFSGTRDS